VSYTCFEEKTAANMHDVAFDNPQLMRKIHELTVYY